MSSNSDDELLNVLTEHHDKVGFLWNAVDHFIRTKEFPEGHKLAVCLDLGYWKRTFSRMVEIWWEQPRLEEIWVVAGESVDFPTLGLCATNAHTMIFDLVSVIDTAVGLSKLTEFFVGGIIGYPSVAAIPDEVLEERLRDALETTALPDWKASQKLRVMFDREFAQAKLHLDVLRRELETASLGGESTGKGVFGKSLADLPPRVQKAYCAKEYVAFQIETTPEELTDREAWEWLKENGIEADCPGLSELATWEVPTYKTWETYQVKARTALGENKHNRRGGRDHGKSVVGAKDLDSPYREDE
jgi:hypothetical protein